MTGTTLSNLKLVGTATAAGGRFARVKVTGETVLAGDLECQQISCMGTLEIKGNLNAGSFRLTGECQVGGNMSSTRMHAIGDLQVAGDFRGDQVKLTGGIRVRGNCEADRLQISGAVTVEGLLNAEDIDIRLHGPSRLREIGCSRITVKKSRAAKVKSLFASGGSAELFADLIEGDSLVLEHTRAAVVRGNRVTIGRGCEIGRVEYRESLEVGSKAVVKEKVKI